ncbi:hypothetical protein DPSP01_010428 [Paraphaeosphaeria sporulosa]
MIFAHEVVDYQDHLQASAAVLRDTVNGICYSDPYLLGYTDKDLQNPQRNHYTPSDSRPNPGRYFLVWPLFLAGMTRTSSRTQRIWISGILEHIGLKMGLKLVMSMSMAMVLAKCDRTQSDGETWLNGDFSAWMQTF